MRTSFLLAALLAVAAPPAAALDRFEIQDYGPDLNAPGEVGAELHLNYAFRGEGAPAFPGEIPPDRSGHFTIEPAIGATEWLEFGAYLQALSAPGSGLRYGGFKLRAKMVVPQRLTGDFFLGLNVEVGRVPKSVEEEGWANEFRPILGWTDGVLLVDLNPIFGYALSGPDAFRVALEPAAKVSVNTQLGFALGVEWYAELGFADALLPAREQQHLLFAGARPRRAQGRNRELGARRRRRSRAHGGDRPQVAGEGHRRPRLLTVVPRGGGAAPPLAGPAAKP